MYNSLYEFPLRPNLVAQAVPGFVGQNKIKAGGWNNYAGLAACGMWSTPTDVAKFLLNLTHSYLDKKPAFLANSLAMKMLTRQENTPFGLGAVISGHGTNFNVAKTGHTKGYQSLLVLFPNLGKGVVVMTNAESGDMLINYFVAIVAQYFRWPYYFPFFDESIFLPDY
jgi:CubicO group peptidase (beta-lactamase class C family)